MLWSPDGNGFGVSLSRSATSAERVAGMADQVQQWAIEDQLWGRGDTNWPPCPAHPDTHPLTAAVVDDAAVWVCPQGGEVVAHVGEI